MPKVNYLLLLLCAIVFSCQEKNKDAQEGKGLVLDYASPDLSGVLDTVNEKELLKRANSSKANQVQIIRKTRIDEISGESCDALTLLYISQHLDSLTEEAVALFLSTFSEECRNNVEFSQWSNELLYKVIHADVNLYMKVLVDNKPDNLEIILNDLREPIIETDLPGLYDKIKTSMAPRELKEQHLEAIITAAESIGEPIKMHDEDS